MKYDQCYAAKDFLREAKEASDELISVLSEEATSASILNHYCQRIRPIMKACRNISSSAVKYSVYEPVLLIARESESSCRVNTAELITSAKYCSNKPGKRDSFELYEAASQNICKRLCEELELCEISERLGCDYLRRIILLNEAVVRLSELASCDEICRSAYPVIKYIAQDARKQLIKMRRLLSLIDDR